MDAEKHVTEDEMLVLLLKVYGQSNEEQLTLQLRRWIADPVQPVDSKGRPRLHPLVCVLAVLISAVVIALIYLAHIQL